jgi:hypothetical protein
MSFLSSGRAMRERCVQVSDLLWVSVEVHLHDPSRALGSGITHGEPLTTRNMDVFSLRDRAVREDETFATSFTKIKALDITEQVKAISTEKRYWPEPLIQINLNYTRGSSIGVLVEEGVLERGCGAIFGDMLLWKHQREAISLASTGESSVVTTSTGSGKSLCFFIPTVNAVLAEKRQGGGRRTRAIVPYQTRLDPPPADARVAHPPRGSVTGAP